MALSLAKLFYLLQKYYSKVANDYSIVVYVPVGEVLSLFSILPLGRYSKCTLCVVMERVRVAPQKAVVFKALDY